MSDANLGDSAPQIQRRGFLKSGTLTGIAASTAMMTLRETTPLPADDRRLIELCRQLKALSEEGERLAALPADASGRTEEIDRNDNAWQALMAEAAKLRAFTVGGTQARVLALGSYIVPDLEEHCAYAWDAPVTAMLRAFVADVTGVA